MEVIPLDHIGTDPNAAMGFMKRRYDLSATGLSNAELQAALRPLLTRQLLRDVRFRLREVVRLSTDQSARIPRLPSSLGKLAELAKSYPDLESVANPVIPVELFAKIDAASCRRCRCRRSCRTSTGSRPIRWTARSSVMWSICCGICARAAAISNARWARST